jgi:hypothetical protein
LVLLKISIAVCVDFCINRKSEKSLCICVNRTAVIVDVAGNECTVYAESAVLVGKRNKRLRSDMPPKVFFVGTVPLTA